MNTPPPGTELEGGADDSWIGDSLPDSSLFFSDPAQAQLLNTVDALAESAEEVALVVGVQGAGKTTFLYRLQGDAPEHWLLCRVDSNPMLHPDQLLNNLAHSVDVPANEDDMPASIGAAFAALRLQGRLPVVLVDDAHQLPISSLMALLRLHENRVESMPACALVMFAEPEILATLATHQLHAMGTEQFRRLDMPRLSPDQTQDYVRHFLYLEGVNAQLDLHPAQLEKLHRDSEGVPGRVNELLVRALRDPADLTHAASKPHMPAPFRHLPPVTMIVAGSVVLLLILSLLFEDQLRHLLNPAGVGDTTVAAEHPAAQPATQTKTPASPHPQDSTELVSQPLDLPPAAPVPKAYSGDAAADVALEVGDDTPEPRAEPPEDSSLTPRDGQAYPKTSDASPRTSPKSATSGGATPRIARIRIEDKAPTDTSRPSRRADGPGAASPPASNRRSGIKSERWLLRQDPQAFTLQILAVREKQALVDYVKRHGLRANASYFETRRGSTPWYSLLYGLYKDRNSALAALGGLPDYLRKDGAWPRPLASIQEEIRKREQ